MTATTTTQAMHEFLRPESDGWLCRVTDGGPRSHADDKCGSTATIGCGGVPDERAAIKMATEVNDLMLELQYGKHHVVLVAVAVLDESDSVEGVRTGAIERLTNRLATDAQKRYTIENSLETLAERGFLNPSPAEKGNAYDWILTEKGWTALTYPIKLGIISTLADSDLTTGV